MRFLFVFVFVSTFSFAQTNLDSSFHVTGNFSDLPAGVTVAFVHPSSGNPIASAVSINQKFELTGKIPFEGLSRINFTGNNINKTFEYFAGNGKITITGKIAELEKAVVSGSPLQNTFKSFIQVFEPQFNTLNRINESISNENDNDKRNDLLNQFNKQKEKVAGKIDSFIAKNDASPVSAFLLYATKDLFMEEDAVATSERIEMLKGAGASSIYATVLNNEIQSKLFGAIGTKAVDFTQNDVNDKPVKLSSFKGKYVLLDFWASWCGPCRNENPNVVAAYNKFKSKNFTVLGVSLDRPGKKADWLEAIKEDNLTWTNVSDLKFWQNEVAQMYKVGSIPQNYLIDPDGKIVGKNLRGEALESKLCELLGCN